MTLKGQDNNDIVEKCEMATEHSIPVLGLYNNHDNTIYIDCVTQTGDSIRQEFNIKPEYPFLDDYQFDIYRSEELSNSADDIYIDTGKSGTGLYSAATDEFGYRVVSTGIDEWGKVRWVYSTEISQSGNAYIVIPIEYQGEPCLAGYVTGEGDWTTVNIHDYSGNTLYTKKDGLYGPHHTAAMVGDDILAVSEVKEYATSNVDECIITELNLVTGKRTLMDLDDIIDPDRAAIMTAYLADDRVHINSIAYSAEDDCYVLSARYQGLIKVKRGATDSSGIVWWMTPDYNVDKEWEEYLLQEVDADGNPASWEISDWSVGQHTASIMPNGDIMMFDNHCEPKSGNSTYEEVSRVWVVRVDEENMAVESINEWTTPSQDYSRYMSSAYYHDDSSTTVSGWATTQTVYESSYPDGEVLFSANFESATSDDDIYRFYKINMYN